MAAAGIALDGDDLAALDEHAVLGRRIAVIRRRVLTCLAANVLAAGPQPKGDPP